MPRLLSFAGVLLIAAVMIGAPCWYKLQYDRRYRNFHVVDEGKLYRSAQLDVNCLKRLVREYGIRTIVSLRDGEKVLDKAEEEWATAAGIKHVRIPPRAWWTADGQWPVPAEIGLAEFRKIMDDPRNHPVLVHCWGGVHRAGLYCAVYRMDYQYWTKPNAIAEMRTLGYTVIDQHSDVLAFLNRYEPHHPIDPRACFGEGMPIDRPPPPPDDGINEEILVPPAPVKVQPARQEEERVSRILSYWDPKIHFTPNTAKSALPTEELSLLMGRVYFFGPQAKHSLTPRGKLIVDLYDLNGPPDSRPLLLARTVYGPDELLKLRSENMIGIGYTVIADWRNYEPKYTRIKVQVTFIPENGGGQIVADPVIVSLQSVREDAGRSTIMPGLKGAPAAPGPRTPTWTTPLPR